MAGITLNRFLVLGRAGLDLLAEPPGASIEEARAFRAELGGAGAGIAAGLAMLGAPVELMGAVPADPIGQRTLAELKRYGVGVDHVRQSSTPGRNPLALAETRTDSSRTVSYRAAGADADLDAAMVERFDWAGAGALIVTCGALASDAARDAVFLAIAAARAQNLDIILHADHRPEDWSNPLDAAAALTRAAEHADIAIGGAATFAAMAGMSGDGPSLARRLAERDGAAAIVLSEAGAETFAAGGSFSTPAFEVRAIKTAGRAEAFTAGLAAALAQGIDLPAAVARGLGAGAMAATRVGVAPAMPRLIELNDFLAARS